MLTVDGEATAHGTFRHEHIVEPWLETLQDIIRATKGSSSQTSLRPRESASVQGNLPQPSEREDTLRGASALHQKTTRVIGSKLDKAPTNNHAQRDSPVEASAITAEWTSPTNGNADQTGVGCRSGLSSTPSLSTDAVSFIEDASWSDTYQLSQQLENEYAALSLQPYSGSLAAESIHTAVGGFHVRPVNEKKVPGIVNTSVDTPITPAMLLPTNVNKQSSTLARRIGKLEQLLTRIQEQGIPAQRDHNEKVKSIYESRLRATTIKPLNMEHFGQLLGELGNISNVVGFVYGLLSWEIFRREEVRLIQEEHQSSKWAAKRVGSELLS